ncbi:MAG: hypothetical protein ABIU77_27455 [Ferruginibacter sp.]
MDNYDDLLRQKENDELFNDSSMEKHWEALENKIDSPAQQPQTKYRKLFRTVIAVAAVSLVAFLSYTLLKENKQYPGKIVAATVTRSAILPPLQGTNVPYETFRLNATTGDTLFTLNGSVIIFPANAVLNGKGEIVNGDIEVRTREFNDPFDYSIAGIPMDYDSAGKLYKFVSSAMIDISAYQHGEPLRVNPGAKPQLNLVSTNKERKTNLYKLDTVNGKWINEGNEEVNLVRLKNIDADIIRDSQPADRDNGKEDATVFNEAVPEIMPAPPQKASDLNPVINVIIDPESFKELAVYNGLKFEVIDADANKVGEDSKTEWNNIELKRGETGGTYKVVFSAGNRKAVYKVKPVLEGKDFEAAEKLYQEKLKAYSKIQVERKKREAGKQQFSAQQIANDKTAAKELGEDNRRLAELNKLITLRNRFIESENIKIDALNKENKRLGDSATRANNEQPAIWGRNKGMATLEQNLIRSFRIDGFGYWNCDQPTLPETQQYVGSFKTLQNEVLRYNSLCIATAGINRIQSYNGTNSIDLITDSSYFGWAINTNQFYYFTRKDFKNAVVTNNPNTISIAMTLYQGDVKNYNKLKGFIFNVNNSNDISKK